MPVISIINQHIGLAEEIKGDKNQKDQKTRSKNISVKLKNFNVDD